MKKALTRFRQVLASEETFYRSLVARLVRFYNLGELSGVDATLKTIKLPTEYMPTNDSDEDESSHAAQFASLQEKKDKIPLLYKGLICLGDLERYKEQYKQPMNNNRHAQERERQADKFEAAEEYYLAAWSLMPDDGSLLPIYNLVHELTMYKRCGMEPARSHLDIHPQRLCHHVLLLSCSRGQECFPRRRRNFAEIFR